MGQKDTTEKLLMDYNDVFADIVNGLLCKGEQVVQPCDLVMSQPILETRQCTNCALWIRKSDQSGKLYAVSDNWL